MDIVAACRNTIQKYSLLTGGDRVLAALSGGPDSVCLLSLLDRLKSEYGLTLLAAYIDHGLRPRETPQEVSFCSALCAGLDVPFFTRKIDVLSFAEERGLNKQEAARELRYHALEEIAREQGAHKLAVGHTADDQIETVLMRLIRGAGPSGLSGIPPVRNNIVRPLIEIERPAIERFLAEEKIGFIVDSSNAAADYLRNRLRREVLPFIKAANPEAARAIGRTAEILREEERYFDLQVTKTLMRLISRRTDELIELFLLPMETMDKVILRRVLRRALEETKGLRGVTLTNVEDIIRLVKEGASGDRLHMPRGVRAVKGYATLLITSAAPAALPDYVLNGPGELVLKEASVVIRCAVIGGPPAAETADGRTTALFSADKLRFPLCFRSRRPGDYFYPLGFGKRKKLQDYFVDEKVPRDARSAVPLLVNEGEIAWVVGYRLDERYRIDKSAASILKCEVRPLKC